MRAQRWLLLASVAVLAATPALTPAAAQDAAPGRFEGRIGLLLQTFRLLSNVDGAFPTALDETASGIEATVRLRNSPFGAEFAFVGAQSAAPNTGKYSLLTLRGVYGGDPLAAEIAVSRRPALNEATNVDLDRLVSVLAVGVRGSTPLGSTPVSLGARGSVYLPLGDEATRGTGFDLQTEVRWTARTHPVGAAVGYRFERFNVRRAEQEFGAVVASVSYVFGRR